MKDFYVHMPIKIINHFDWFIVSRKRTWTGWPNKTGAVFLKIDIRTKPSYCWTLTCFFDHICAASFVCIFFFISWRKCTFCWKNILRRPVTYISHKNQTTVAFFSGFRRCDIIAEIHLLFLWERNWTAEIIVQIIQTTLLPLPRRNNSWDKLVRCTILSARPWHKLV